MDEQIVSAVDGQAVKRVYTFNPVTACNMCGAPAANAEVLGLRLNQSQGQQPRGKRGIAVTICRCRNCCLVFTDPQPVPPSIADHYGIPPETYWQKTRLDPDPKYFTNQITTAKRLLNFTPGMRAIDVGVGLGKAVRAMQNAGFEVSGFEPSEPFHRKALQFLAMDDSKIKLGSVEDVEFDPGQADFVTFGAVLEHLYDPSAAIAKALRWLKPGGIIHAEVPNANHLISRIINGYYRAIGTSYVTNLSPMHMPFHLFEFTLDTFRRNGARQGYAVDEHTVDVCSIYNIPRPLHPLLRRIMERNKTGMQLTVWLRKAGD